jgi:hypothetical protein
MAENAMIRIANCSGFYGDRVSAAREMIEGGPIDVLCGDYLAELTMFLLARSEIGYARTFLRQMEEIIGVCVDRGVKVVTNAGGLNPAGLAEAVSALDTGAVIAYVVGDDLRERFPGAVSANAYLGSWGIVEALCGGADIVITGRVTDAALVVGPAAWRFDWQPSDFDRLAGAVAAGHVLECGPQATGGNFAFFKEVPGIAHPGFPIAEIFENGSAVITKHDGTGGLVSVETVAAQLLYEIGDARYVTPDAIARFDTIRLEQQGRDRVGISGVVGEPPPATLKVSINDFGGYRNTMTFVLVGLDLEEKAALVRQSLAPALDGLDTEFSLTRVDDGAHLRIVVRGADERRVGRAFSSAAIELSLASYPGFHTTTPPGNAHPYAINRVAFIDRGAAPQRVCWSDGRTVTLPVAPAAPARDESLGEARRPGVTNLDIDERGVEHLPLGTCFGARSGDKGADANVGIWARGPKGFTWLEAFLTPARFKTLVPEAVSLSVRRVELPNLLALNFIVSGLLGPGGVSASTRADPQAKGLGEYLRSRVVALPRAVIAEAANVAEENIALANSRPV